jgi:prepilin-type N-terminal cleavage/methylation domain-containing protein
MKFVRKNNGYTLIEILIVIAITVIVLSIVLNSFYSLAKIQALDKDYISVASLLDQAKSQTINSKSASQYGVYFASSTAILFRGGSYTSSSTDNQTYSLNSRVNISSINLTGSTTDQVVFSRLTGYASASGTISISL